MFGVLGATAGATTVAGIAGGTAIGLGTAALVYAPVAALIAVANALVDVFDPAATLGHAVLEFGNILFHAIAELDKATSGFTTFVRRNILQKLVANSSDSYEITQECCESVKKAQLCRCQRIYLHSKLYIISICISRN